MRRLAAVVVIAVAGFVASVVVFSSSSKRGCPLDAAKNGSYSGTFEGPVSVEQTRHVLRVTQGGRPVSGARLCVNTEMMGMSGMGYSVKGSELAPGRYGVGLQFGMPGKYRGNLVTQKGGDEVSIPFLIDVGKRAPPPSASNPAAAGSCRPPTPKGSTSGGDILDAPSQRCVRQLSSDKK